MENWNASVSIYNFFQREWQKMLQTLRVNPEPPSGEEERAKEGPSCVVYQQNWSAYKEFFFFLKKSRQSIKFPTAKEKQKTNAHCHLRFPLQSNVKNRKKKHKEEIEALFFDVSSPTSPAPIEQKKSSLQRSGWKSRTRSTMVSFAEFVWTMQNVHLHKKTFPCGRPLKCLY